MGESATPLWPVAGAEEFDRRIRSLAPSSAPPTDPLAELARLVGEQDPFRPSEPNVPTVPAPAAPLASEVDFAAFDAAFRTTDDDLRLSSRYPLISVRDPHPVEPSPDAWAEGAESDADKPDAVPLIADDPDRAEAGGSKRTLIVLAAVIVLTGGGLLASFMAKPSKASMAAATATPTILAATGPSKVQPETPAAGADAPSEPSTLLDKNNNDGTGAAKVVNTVEQPVDLAQAVKPSAPAATVAQDTVAAPDAAAVTEAPPAASSGAFPAPRKVKTVLVRPDGSIIAQGATAATDDASVALSGDQTSLAFDPRTSLPIAAAAASVPAASAPSDAAPAAVPPKPVGKTTTRVAPPKPVASTTQGGSATAEARTPVATPKAKPVAHVPPKPKPAAVADATPTATTPDAATPDAAQAPAAATGGAFAIQIGAATSEAEGQGTAARLAAKYGLDSTPSVVQAQAGGKTVYRIRFGHLSQDDAKTLCAKVKGAGGGCFVARN